MATDFSWRHKQYDIIIRVSRIMYIYIKCICSAFNLQLKHRTFEYMYKLLLIKNWRINLILCYVRIQILFYHDDACFYEAQ